MIPGQNYFKKISDPVEKEQLFRDICQTPCEILAKAHSTSSEVTLLKAEVYNQPTLSLRVIDSDFMFPASGEIILQITIGSEKYLCSSPFRFENKFVTLKTLGPLFQLQRREDFRIKIPDTFQAVAQILTINGMPANRSLKIIDLSAGGCRLTELQPITRLTNGVEVTGRIDFSQRPSFDFAGKVLHSNVEDDQKSQTIGLSFSNLTPPAKNNLAALVMDLYRQLFSKLN